MCCPDGYHNSCYFQHLTEHKNQQNQQFTVRKSTIYGQLRYYKPQIYLDLGKRSQTYRFCPSNTPFPDIKKAHQSGLFTTKADCNAQNQCAVSTFPALHPSIISAQSCNISALCSLYSALLYTAL